MATEEQIYGSLTSTVTETQDALEEAAYAVQTSESGGLPVISGDVQFDTNGLIKTDTFTLDWEEFVDSDALYVDSGEVTIYKETITEYETGGTGLGLTPLGSWWNFYESVGATTTAITTTPDTTNVDPDITVFNISLGTSETSALEAKYSQTDYSIDDVYGTSNIGTAFSSVISEVITTTRLSTKFIWNKSHQKPFKKPNETAIGAPTDDE
jgi:hypothetical protein